MTARTVVAPALLVLFALTAAACATEDGVLEEPRERGGVGSVPISKKPFDGAKVLFSVKLGELSPEDDLLLRSECTLSTCGRKDVSGDSSDGEKSPCSIPKLKQSPYSYSPHFGAYPVLGDSDKC